MVEIRVAIVGVGNCASALVEGKYYYEDYDANDDITGVMTENFQGYEVSDINPVCAFDVDDRKTNKDIADAMAVNDYYQFGEIPDEIGCPVYRGPVYDGVAEHMNDDVDDDTFIVNSDNEAVDITEKLVSHDVDVLVNYLPVGSEKAAESYAEACLEVGVAMVNAMPVFLASDPEWNQRFKERGLPIVGDDIKSQIGATIAHRTLVTLLKQRGIDIDNTYQLNIGGNTDFKNMLDSDRLASKKISKTDSVNSQLDERLNDKDIHIGPSDYVPWLNDNKLAFIKINGKNFGGAPVTIDLELSVEDSPNSAGSAVDAIRAAKNGLDTGQSGALNGISAYTMKHPPVQLTDKEAKRRALEQTE